MDPQYIDPPLGKSVTSQEVADKVKALDASHRYDKPIDISAWIPERPYWSSPTLLRDMEAYYARLDEVEKELARSTTRSCSSAAAARSSTSPTTTGSTR